MIMAWAHASPNSLPYYAFSGIYRECQDVKLARRVAQICEQRHHVIVVDETFLKDFPCLAERTVYLTDGAMDVSGAAELFVNRAARQIAPIRLTGNYGQEILRREVAFGPTPIDDTILDEDFAELVARATKTYHEEISGDRLSFIAFKQVPWHHYSRLALELSQLLLRSPFLDNDFVSLCYRVPEELSHDVGIQLRLIAERNQALARVGTDRAVYGAPTPIFGAAEHMYQEFTFKAEYAYDYGMPQWMAKVDNLIRPFHLERLFLGRHKFYHFRVWYRDQLASYIKDVLLDPRTLKRPYLRGKHIEAMVRRHIKGTWNYTSEIHRILTSELIQRQLTE
jgi:asparagine synthase (glutamine-hydrolysing)